MLIRIHTHHTHVQVALDQGDFWEQLDPSSGDNHVDKSPGGTQARTRAGESTALDKMQESRKATHKIQLRALMEEVCMCLYVCVPVCVRVGIHKHRASILIHSRRQAVKSDAADHKPLRCNCVCLLFVC